MKGIHQWLGDSPYKSSVIQEVFPCYDVFLQSPVFPCCADCYVTIFRTAFCKLPLSLQWCRNEHYGVSNHLPKDCLLKRLFKPKSKKTSKLHITGLCEGNTLVTGEFPTQRASNAENFSISWCHRILGGWNKASIIDVLPPALKLNEWLLVSLKNQKQGNSLPFLTCCRLNVGHGRLIFTDDTSS